MQTIPRTKLHRKFIAFVLATSIAITGFSSTPARADDDVAKIIAGLAVLGILGAAINKERHRNRVVTPTPVRPEPVRPLPPSVARYDLPAKCVRYYPKYGNGNSLLGQRCLKNNYRFHVSSLPQQCRVTFWDGRNHKTGFKPSCMQQKGYRIVRR